jgi:tRNA pseudouridine38-40 synthase
MRAKLVVAYDGTGFHGFADNAGVRTVVGVLSDALSRVARTPVALTGAGRTDAGVHAWGQVVSGDLPDGTDLDGVVRRLNKLCGPDIAVRSAGWVNDDFDARFSARWRHYRYDVWNAAAPNPLLVGNAWHVVHPLDLDAMTAASAHVVGEHDFSSFCRRVRVDEGEPERSRVRTVMQARWSEAPWDVGDGRLLRFEIRANAFCHQMVRSIVGTLVDVGAGKYAPGDLPSMLAAAHRGAAGQVAPPHGLTLWEVGYDTDPRPRR